MPSFSVETEAFHVPKKIKPDESDAKENGHIKQKRSTNAPLTRKVKQLSTAAAHVEVRAIVAAMWIGGEHFPW